jgi:hypothetical protein
MAREIEARGLTFSTKAGTHVPVPAFFRSIPKNQSCCLMVEGDNGIVLNQETKQQPFGYDDACVEKGPTVAYQEAASMQARAYVRGFLKEVFALK